MLDIIITFIITASVFFLLGRYTHKLKVRRIQRERLQTFDQRQTELIRTLPDILLQFGDFTEDEIMKYSEILEYHHENLSGTCLGVLNSMLFMPKDAFSNDDIRCYFDALECMMSCQNIIHNSH